MADDDIKKDADNQRSGKPGPSPEEASAAERSDALKSIKEALIEQTKSYLDEGEGANAVLNEIGRNVLRIADLQAEMWETNLETLRLEKQNLEGASVRKLDDQEEQREMLKIFQEIRDALKGGPGGAPGLGDEDSNLLPVWTGKKGGKQGPSKGLIGGLVASLGFFGKNIGIGLGAIGLGIGLFMGGMAVADMITHSWGDRGEALRDMLTNLGIGLVGMGKEGMAALGVMFGVAALGFGKKAGLGMGIIGAGLATFFIALGAADSILGGTTGVKGLDWMASDYSFLPGVMANFKDSIGALGKEGQIALVSLLGSAALLGQRGVWVGPGMASIGAGIAAFYGALGAGDATMAWMDVDGSRLKEMVINMTDAITYIAEKDAAWGLAGLLAVGGLFGQMRSAKTQAKTVVGIGVMGAGIGAFFTGLGVNDWALSKLGSKGENLKAMMINIVEGLNAFSNPQLKALLATGAIFGAVSAVSPAIAAKAAVGLGLAGLGIGAFIGGMAIGGKAADMIGADGTGLKNILTNMAKGLSEFNSVNAKNLAQTAAGMAVLAPAMILLLTGKTVTAIGEGVAAVGGWVKGWFSDDDSNQFQRLAQNLKEFEALNTDGMKNAATNVDLISSSLQSFAGLDEEAVSEGAKAAVKSLKELEKGLSESGPSLLNLKPTITFKALLDTTVLDKQVNEYDLINFTLRTVPDDGLMLAAAGDITRTIAASEPTQQNISAPTTISQPTTNTSITNVDLNDSKTHRSLIVPGGQFSTF